MSDFKFDLVSGVATIQKDSLPTRNFSGNFSARIDAGFDLSGNVDSFILSIPSHNNYVYRFYLAGNKFFINGVEKTSLGFDALKAFILGNVFSKAGGAALTTVTAVQQSAYTANGGEIVPVDTTSGNVPIAVTSTSLADGKSLVVKHIIQGGTNSVTVNLTGLVYNKAGGATSLTLSLLNQAVILQRVGNIVYVLADDLSLSQLDLRFGTLAAQNANTNAIATNTNAIRLPFNSELVSFGDSITANANFVSGVQSGNLNKGFVTYANIYCNSAFYLPPLSNLGVSGNTTTQMLARVASIMPFKPKVVTVLGGTNDLNASVSLATIQVNLKLIYADILAQGAIVVAITVLPRFSPAALSAPNEANRILLNTWIKAQASDRIKVVDAENTMNDTTLLIDGLHPNAAGAKTLGSLVGVTLATLIQTTPSISDLAINNDSFILNSQMAGTGGTLNTASGTVATSWILRGDSSGGATVLGSKSTDAATGLEQQVITISGTYSGGANKFVGLRQDFQVQSLLFAGDIVEGFLDIEIISALTNVTSVAPDMFVLNAASGTIVEGVGIFSVDQPVSFPLGIGRYVMRTVPIVIPPTGNPNSVINFLKIYLNDTGASTLSVAGSFKIHRAGLRKIEDKGAVKSDLVLKADRGRVIADVASTLGNNDSSIFYTSLTATRALTLPAASTITIPQGARIRRFMLKDEAGTAGTNNLTIVGTVNGVVNPTAINTNYGVYRFYSNGTAWFSE